MGGQCAGVSRLPQASRTVPPLADPGDSGLVASVILKDTTHMRIAALTLAFGLAACGAMTAQEPLEVGTKAPDFTLPAATAEGIVKPVQLSELRGRTVVLAFFYKARTKG